MIDPKKEIFKWGPIEGRPIYIDIFVEAFVKYPDFIDGSWPDSIGYFKDDFVTFIFDDHDLRQRGEHLFKEHVMNDSKLKKAYDEWIEVTKRIKQTEERVNKGLSGMSDHGLYELLVKWNKIHLDFWLTGFLPELSNWGGEQILKKKIIKSYKKGFIEIFEKLSAPENISFFEKEQLEFMKIKLMAPLDRERQIAVHQMNYYWLRNNYGSTKMLEEQWFRKELEKISREEAENRIKEINHYPEKVRQEKDEAIQKYSIPKEIVRIADKLAYCVLWQDYRKSFIFIANHIVTQFVREISRRKQVDFKELCCYTTEELEHLMEKGTKAQSRERLEGFLQYYNEGDGLSYFTGKEAQNMARPFLKVDFDPNMNEFKGIVVSMGEKVRGRAIVMNKPEPERMQQGDILIAPMTSPDYVVAMRKASAIITDAGGMTCHAAIVSRELDVPCIVNTKIATKLLKDGDMIEVDTKKGVVRKIK
ncbi:MAG: hypothetical protein KKE20_06485 [Nanoarchaeota archaeon]|nr:hypothetical protein [Nanoarchaeota archaeon]